MSLHKNCTVDKGCKMSYNQKETQNHKTQSHNMETVGGMDVVLFVVLLFEVMVLALGLAVLELQEVGCLLN